tara:strand:- start:1708 stop:2421 length:714 start_codon:yes stop_codon:yes gene_type:complete
VINITCALWTANKLSKQFSRHYTEADVCALYRGFKAHLNVPFRFICWSERERDYAEPGIEQRRLRDERPSYGSLTQCYELNEPTIMVGLDTVIVGNLDHIAAYCLGASKPAVPMDPFKPTTVCNGVTLVPGGNDWLWTEYQGQNDMDWIRDNWKAGRIVAFDDIFSKQIVSYKAEIRAEGLGEDTRIVYFHGEHKMHELPHVGWIAKHWDYRPEDARHVRDPALEKTFAVHTGFPGA